MDKHHEFEEIISTYFNLEHGGTEEGNVAYFQENLNSNRFQEYMARLVEAAFKDPCLSWQQLLYDNNVAFYDAEEEAREYAKKIFWDNVFPSLPCPEVTGQ